MGDQEWHEHVKAAADRALRRVREDLNANPPYDNDVPYWPDTVMCTKGRAVGARVAPTFSTR
jgi:hypothetical protein